jgi:hypothetical protein
MEAVQYFVKLNLNAHIDFSKLPWYTQFTKNAIFVKSKITPRVLLVNNEQRVSRQWEPFPL